ncbi:MAG: hypothetical protein Q8936_10825 [Bacillota bacterium]|nr:hypothetical protein [Bacillota bacterium]
MKKVYIGIILSALIASGAAAGVVYNNHINKVNVQHLELDLINQKSNLSEVVASSELIVKGKVSKITPVEVHSMIFTDYEINVDEALKGKTQKVTVRLTGGTLNNIEQIADGIKQLDKDQEYIFCLQKVYPDDDSSNLYSPIGALQGIFSVDELSNGKVKIKDFNKQNNIENSVKGKEFDKNKDFK